MRTKAKKVGKGYSMLVLLLVLLLLSPIEQLLISAKSGQISPPLMESYWTDVKVAPSGSGTSADPYIIDSAEKLAYLVGDDQWGYRQAFFSQTKDIDLGGKRWTAIGSLSSSANTLRYNGNGYKIANMSVIDGGSCRGLFGYTWNCTIENVNIVNPYVVGGSQSGGIVGNGEQTWIRNCNVSGGYIKSIQAGGIAGYIHGAAGSLENVSSSSIIYATEDGGGIVGGYVNIAGSGRTNLVRNAYFTGSVESASEAGGIIGELNNGNVSGVTAKLENCYIEATLRAQKNCGGIVAYSTAGSGSVVIQNCGFNGDMYGQENTNVGSMVGRVVGATSVSQSFGIAEVFGGKIKLFGADNVTWGDSFSYTRYTKDDAVNTFAKYKVVDGMKNFKYSPYINGGYPFPKGMFAVGGELPEQDVIAYLKSYGFDKFNFEIKTLINSTYGTDKYVEFGQYPQTYVGSSMNSTLESWYSGKSVVKRFYVDNGASATSNVYDAYTYTDGKTYVRVPMPRIYTVDNDHVYEDGTSAKPNAASWFEVKPIRWLILNYADMQNEAAPIVVTEKILTSSVTWNKSFADLNIWSGTSNIRTWINGTFYSDAFNVDDKNSILTTTVKNNTQSSTSDGTGTSTNDKLWLLSYDEVNKYFTTNAQRLASPTDFAIANYCYSYKNTGYITTARPQGGTCGYWLRSAYTAPNSARFLNQTGVPHYEFVDYSGYGVRPALTLTI